MRTINTKEICDCVTRLFLKAGLRFTPSCLAALQNAEQTETGAAKFALSALLENEKIAQVFFDMGMHCLGCPISRGETVAEAAEAHGNDVNELVNKLNAVIA